VARCRGHSGALAPGRTRTRRTCEERAGGGANPYSSAAVTPPRCPQAYLPAVLQVLLSLLSVSAGSGTRELAFLLLGLPVMHGPCLFALLRLLLVAQAASFASSTNCGATLTASYGTIQPVGGFFDPSTSFAFGSSRVSTQGWCQPFSSVYSANSNCAPVVVPPGAGPSSAWQLRGTPSGHLLYISTSTVNRSITPAPSARVRHVRTCRGVLYRKHHSDTGGSG